MKHTLVIQDKDSEYHGLSYLQRKIITEIIKLRNQYYSQNGFFFDMMYVSTAMCNLLSDSPSFHSLKDVTFADELTSHPVGMINDIKVFVDMSVNRNQIKLSTDKNKLRHLKINTILDDESKKKIFEISIDVESDFF